MPRRLHNWTYKDVTTFIRMHGFHYSKTIKGSHQAWVKPPTEGNAEIRIELNFTHGTYPPKTLRTIIYQSKIDKREWLKWADGKGKKSKQK